MIEELRSATASLGWRFSYGIKQFQNLTEATDENDATPHFHLDPITRENEYTKSTGNPTGWQMISGSFMILVKSGSSIEEVYDNQLTGDEDQGKWLKRIEPIVNQQTGLLAQLMNELTCNTSDFKVVSQTIKEVINVFDDNKDGVLVDFRWKYRP